MKNIKELRTFLGETMKELRDGKLSVDKAKIISELGQVIVNSAKTEVDFIKAAKVKNATDFISDAIIKPLGEEVNAKPVADVKPFERPKAEYTNSGHLEVMEKYGN